MIFTSLKDLYIQFYIHPLNNWMIIYFHMQNSAWLYDQPLVTILRISHSQNDYDSKNYYSQGSFKITSSYDYFFFFGMIRESDKGR